MGQNQDKCSRSLVKSASRVLSILEYFREVGHASTVMQVARALELPQSSASALLQSLVALDYLNYNRRERTYSPTARVALLGSGVQQLLFGNGRILSAMQELNDQTGEMVVLAIHNEVHVRFIHTIEARNPMRLHVVPGTIKPMPLSGMGRLFLSTFSEERVRGIIHKLNSDIDDDAERVSISEILRDLKEIRRRGFAISLNSFTPGAGIVAHLLPTLIDHQQLAIALCGPSEVIRLKQASYSELLRIAVEKCS